MLWRRTKVKIDVMFYTKSCIQLLYENQMKMNPSWENMHVIYICLELVWYNEEDYLDVGVDQTWNKI